MISTLSTQDEQIMQGLLVDHMEDGKALECIGHALDLITGLRPKDVIYEYVNSGIALDSVLVRKILYLDHMINVTAAEIIETLVQYRGHSSQKCHIIECIISRKRYQGPVFNATVGEAKLESNEYVRRLLRNLFIINHAAIDILRNV